MASADNDLQENVSVVYVGGFLSLYSEEPEDVSLRLPREVVTRHLRLESVIDLPLNVNHEDTAVVGSVYELFDLDAGLFCFGEIYSSSFLRIVQKAAARSKMVARGPEDGLDPDPVVEYLSTGFPGLSLSSAAIVVASASADGGYREERAETFFRHVSICGVGRRRGTLAVYGRDPIWILSRFKLLSTDEFVNVSSRISDGSQRIARRRRVTKEDPFFSDSYGLLASSVDTAYIRERFKKLEYDKRILGLDHGTYIKASEAPSDGSECNIKEVDESSDDDRRDGAMAQGHAASGATPVSLPAVAAGQSSVLPSDCVYLSRDALVSILDTHRQGFGVPYAPVSDFGGVSAGHQPQMGRRYDSYPHSPPMFSMDPRRYSGSGGQLPVVYDGSRAHRDLWYPSRHHPEVAALYDPYYARFGYVNPVFRLHDDDREEGFFADRDIPERGGGGRKRPSTTRPPRRRQIVESDEDDVNSFPGDVDYPGKKRVKTAESSRDSDVSANALGEVRATLDAIRKDLSRIKTGADGTTDGGGVVRRVDKTTPTMTSSEQDNSGSVIVGSSGQKWSDLVQTAERMIEKSEEVESRGPVTVNAACEPPIGGKGTMSKSDILEVNRRMFVSVLNKLDS